VKNVLDSSWIYSFLSKLCPPCLHCETIAYCACLGYIAAVTGSIHCAYPRRMARLSWPRWVLVAQPYQPVPWTVALWREGRRQLPTHLSKFLTVGFKLSYESTHKVWIRKFHTYCCRNLMAWLKFWAHLRSPLSEICCCLSSWKITFFCSSPLHFFKFTTPLVVGGVGVC